MFYLINQLILYLHKEHCNSFFHLNNNLAKKIITQITQYITLLCKSCMNDAGLVILIIYLYSLYVYVP